jgi:predicted nucleic acid-binding protein
VAFPARLKAAPFQNGTAALSRRGRVEARAMADKYFVDTNILIYAHDRAAGVKHERARQLIESLWTSGQGVLSTQVLQELCVNLRRKVARPLGVDEIRELVHDYMSWEIVVNSAEAVIQALEIEVRYKTSFWDALNSAGGGAVGRGDSLLRGLGGGAELRDGSGGESAGGVDSRLHFRKKSGRI